MYFFKPGGWEVQFLEAELKTPPARKLTFVDAERIRELAKRGGAAGLKARTRSVRQLRRKWGISERKLEKLGFTAAVLVRQGE